MTVETPFPMPRYIVRVELRDTDRNSHLYDKLHKLMDADGFKRTIRVDGDEFQLPHAEYVSMKDGADMREILLDASLTVRKLGDEQKFSLVITQVAGMLVRGLAPGRSNSA